jgi:hypothetical protein
MSGDIPVFPFVCPYPELVCPFIAAGFHAGLPKVSKLFAIEGIGPSLDVSL